MATTAFDVTPEEVERSAQVIEEKKNEFVQAYQKIYNAVDELKVEYKGESSAAFNQKIESYRSDFEKAAKALDSYINFLKEYATKIKNTENGIKEQANSLKSGR